MSYENNATAGGPEVDWSEFLLSSPDVPAVPLESTTVHFSEDQVDLDFSAQVADMELAPLSHNAPAALGWPHVAQNPVYYDLQATQNVSPLPYAIPQEPFEPNFQLSTMYPALQQLEMPQQNAAYFIASAPPPEPVLVANPVVDTGYGFNPLMFNPWTQPQSFNPPVDPTPSFTVGNYATHYNGVDLTPSFTVQNYATPLNEAASPHVFSDLTNWTTPNVVVTTGQAPPPSVPAVPVPRHAPAPRPSQVARASRMQSVRMSPYYRPSVYEDQNGASSSRSSPYDSPGLPAVRPRLSKSAKAAGPSDVPPPLDVVPPGWKTVVEEKFHTRFFTQPASFPHMTKATKFDKLPERIQHHVCPYVDPLSGTACWSQKWLQPEAWLMVAGKRKEKGFFARHRPETLRHLAEHRLKELEVPPGMSTATYLTIPENSLTSWEHEEIDNQILEDAFNAENQTWFVGENRPSHARLRQLLSVSPHFEVHRARFDTPPA